jgi:hypothetical protein
VIDSPLFGRVIHVYDVFGGHSSKPVYSRPIDACANSGQSCTFSLAVIDTDSAQWTATSDPPVSLHFDGYWYGETVAARPFPDKTWLVGSKNKDQYKIMGGSPDCVSYFCCCTSPKSALVLSFTLDELLTDVDAKVGTFSTIALMGHFAKSINFPVLHVRLRAAGESSITLDPLYLNCRPQS